VFPITAVALPSVPPLRPPILDRVAALLQTLLMSFLKGQHEGNRGETSAFHLSPNISCHPLFVTNARVHLVRKMERTSGPRQISGNPTRLSLTDNPSDCGRFGHFPIITFIFLVRGCRLHFEKFARKLSVTDGISLCGSLSRNRASKRERLGVSIESLVEIPEIRLLPDAVIDPADGRARASCEVTRIGVCN
jgi:hypothetical protein